MRDSSTIEITRQDRADAPGRPPASPMNTVADIRVERLRASFQQVPFAVVVTIINSVLISAVLLSIERDRRIYPWLAITTLVAVARFILSQLYRRAPQVSSRYWRWSAASTGGAFAAGLLWGGGSVLLLPESETYQLLWVFLIGGMCAGAAALHYAHLPTTLAFILPAGLPLAIRFALEGSGQRAAAAIMIAVFLAVLTITSRRSSRYFSENLRLHLDLAQRTRELDAINMKLRTEIEEHRATEAILRHAQKMEAVGQLAGGIAHDFNNLLTVVIGSLGLLRKHLPAGDSKASVLLDNAAQSAERGAALIRRLLAFARRQVLMPTIVDLPTLVRGTSALLSSSIGPRVQIAMCFPETLPPVTVDPNQLELALINLVVNARDAMPNGGSVTINIHEAHMERSEVDGLSPGHYVVLRVSDTGQGMDEATLSRAMEPFFTTKEIGKGTGLGLSMVHGLTVQSGGQFRLYSKIGTGTTAELWLPQAGAMATPVA